VVEVAQGFALENWRSRNVKSRILAGDSFALGRAGSRGFGGVGPVGSDLTFGCHAGPRVDRECAGERGAKRESVEGVGDVVRRKRGLGFG
jgi:hypothetical protein